MLRLILLATTFFASLAPALAASSAARAYVGTLRLNSSDTSPHRQRAAVLPLPLRRRRGQRGHRPAPAAQRPAAQAGVAGYIAARLPDRPAARAARHAREGAAVEAEGWLDVFAPTDGREGRNARERAPARRCDAALGRPRAQSAAQKERPTPVLLQRRAPARERRR